MSLSVNFLHAFRRILWYLILFVMASIQQARCLLLSVIGKREGDRVRHKLPIPQSFRTLYGPTGKAGGMKWPSDGSLRQMNAGVLLSWHHQQTGLTVSRDSDHDRMPTWCWGRCFSKYIWAYHEDLLTPPSPHPATFPNRRKDTLNKRGSWAKVTIILSDVHRMTPSCLRFGAWVGDPVMHLKPS